MRAPQGWSWPRLDGLAIRVAAFLTLALLPLGLIAIYQTREVQHESEQGASLSLLALTGQSAAGVGQAIERALGTAETLGVVADLLDDPATCSGYLRRFVEDGGPYAFVGLLPRDGPVACSSAAAPFELADREDWDALLADPRPRVRADARDRVSGQDVIIVLVPLLGSGGTSGEGSADVPGYLSLSLPRAALMPTARGRLAGRPLRLVTFSQDGTILTSTASGDGTAEIDGLLPVGASLAGQAGGEARFFAALDGTGERRLYTVVPLVPDVAYALAVWSPLQGARGASLLERSPLLFPMLMWAASLAVAFWAIHRLVIRQVTDLAARMRRFGRDRSLPEAPLLADSARELQQIDLAFRQTAESILQDEARMENAFRERGALLREVHHRVKNNLQLISSIISMQVRRSGDPRTRAILRRLQDRVMTLAAIYRSLYAGDDMAEMDAAPVLRAIVAQELQAVGDAEVTLDLEEIVLDPDKVVPLAFLASEALSNAVAHAGGPEGRPRLAVSLTRDGPEATLVIVNSTRGDVPAPPDDAGQGLGQHLIRAFAAQVGGPAVVTAEAGAYRLSITFPIDLDATA